MFYVSASQGKAGINWGFSLPSLSGLPFLPNMSHLWLGAGGSGLSDNITVFLFPLGYLSVLSVLLPKGKDDTYLTLCVPRKVESPGFGVLLWGCVSFQFGAPVFRVKRNIGSSVVAWVLILLLLQSYPWTRHLISLNSSYSNLPDEGTRLGSQCLIH